MAMVPLFVQLPSIVEQAGIPADEASSSRLRLFMGMCSCLIQASFADHTRLGEVHVAHGELAALHKDRQVNLCATDQRGSGALSLKCSHPVPCSSL